MKRLFLIVLGLSICLFLASCSVSETNNKFADKSNEDQNTNDTNHDNTNLSPPSNILYFDSFQHIAQLKNILGKDDATVKAYLDKNYRGGILSKKDVSGMFAVLDDLNMLHLDSSSGYYLDNIVYYGCYGYIMSTYVNKDKMIRITCYIDLDNTIASETAVGLQDFDVADKIAFGDEEINLYYSHEKSPNPFCCYVNTPNSLIATAFYDDDKNAAKDVIEKYAISTTLNDLITKYTKYPPRFI